MLLVDRHAMLDRVIDLAPQLIAQIESLLQKRNKST